MAKVFAKAVGQGSVAEYDAETISDLKTKMGLTGSWGASVNRTKVEDSHKLTESDTVILSENVKGA
ncbi:MAG: hypothetical protein ACXABY_12530 [Candidatus Thorarchaeota archaeon]|jgi:hypothetical protein